MKPLLAVDWVEEKIKFPLLGQPKVDGVRGLVHDSSLVARSLKRFANNYTVGHYSRTMLTGFDGELYCGNETDSDLCRKTVSALNTIEGQPFVKWKLFDIFNLKDTVYLDRWEELKKRVMWLHQNTDMGDCIEIMPYEWIHDMSDLLALEARYLALNYEGMIIRDPFAQYKHGYSSTVNPILWRIKRYQTDEAFVVDIIEGETNTNAAETNLLGKIERSTHKENMIPNGKVGSLIVRTLEDKEIVISAGKMTDEERVYYFNNPKDIIGKFITYKHFPHGAKDKPRQPTFQGFRMEVDF